MQRLYHLDRILFGSNTILVFKYPLMKRKLLQIKSKFLSEIPDISAEELEQTAKQVLLNEPLIQISYSEEESKEAGDDDALRRTAMTVEDYDDDEVEDDDRQIDWDFAMDEILKIENRKKDKANEEAKKKMDEERTRIEEDLKKKYEEEQRINNEELQK